MLALKQIVRHLPHVSTEVVFSDLRHIGYTFYQHSSKSVGHVVVLPKIAVPLGQGLPHISASACRGFAAAAIFHKI